MRKRRRPIWRSKKNKPAIPLSGMATTVKTIANVLPKLDKTALTKTVLPKVAKVLPTLL